MRTQAICLALFIGLLCPYASAQWVRTNGPYSHVVYQFPVVNALVVSGTNLVAATEDFIFLSTNDGANWSWVQSNLNVNSILSLIVSGTNLFAATFSCGVYLSTDNGTSWTQVSTGLPIDIGVFYWTVRPLAVSGSNLFAGTGKGVFRSTNNGTSWTAVDSGLTNTYVSCLAVSGTNLFAGTGGGVFLSSNNGTNWTPVNSGLTDTNVQSFAVSGTNLFAGTVSTWGSSQWRGGGVFRSTNSGASWTAVNAGLPISPTEYLRVQCFFVMDTTLLVSINGNGEGIIGGGVFRSTNNGTNWTALNSGLPDANVMCFAVSGSNLFAGTWGAGVWRRPLSEIMSVIEPIGGPPSAFSLRQNYPNPFNPSTTIKYELPNAFNVSLTVYDILGRQVFVLVNERKDAGVYEVKCDGSNLASGVYFYRLQAGDYVATKRFLLLK
jgi:hypothetical protein